MHVADGRERVRRFETIYHDTFDHLRHTFLKLTRNEASTHDLLQAAYIKLWQKLDEIEDRGDYAKILYVYARNLYRDELRKQLRRELATTEMGYLAAQTEHSTPVEVRELERIVQETVEGMPARRQQVYRLFREDGLSYKSIAALLEISPKTVDNHLQEASREIRKQLRLAYHVDGLSVFTILLLAEVITK